MKTIILGILFLFTVQLNAQQKGIVTQTVLVKGNCEECKKRIENAADIKGVKLCVWNPDTKIATITFNADVTSLEKITQAIANVGYDAGTIKGNDKSYQKLPGCCKYRDGKCTEPGK